MTTCEVIPFPLERRNALVREIASDLQHAHGEAANVLWRGVAKRFLGELQAEGLDPAKAAAQVRKLFAAIHAELQAGAPAIAATN